jgi:hypothetical protein
MSHEEWLEDAEELYHKGTITECYGIFESELSKCQVR